MCQRLLQVSGGRFHAITDAPTMLIRLSFMRICLRLLARRTTRKSPVAIDARLFWCPAGANEAHSLFSIEVKTRMQSASSREIGCRLSVAGSCERRARRCLHMVLACGWY